ncbi:MAG: hypothetical protein V2A56_00130 [bacterium]
MSDHRPFNDAISLIIVANEYPNELLAERLKKAHGGQYFREIYMRWRELFKVVPEAKSIRWHAKIDFPDEEMFYNTMRLVVESDATDEELYEEIVAVTDGLTLRWKEFLRWVPSAGDIDWWSVAGKFPSADWTLENTIDDLGGVF